MAIGHRYENIGFATINMDCGCMVVWKEPGKKKQPILASTLDWKTYKNIGSVLLNVVEPEVFFNSELPELA